MFLVCRSPGTDAICRAASASPTSPMRSVAAPRVKLSSLIVSVDHKDLTGCRVENRQAGDGDAPDHYMGIVRYRARAHEPAAPRHVTFMSGEQLLLLGSPQDHRLYNSDAQPLVFVELRCPLDGDVPASAAFFRRRRYIPTSLVAASAPCIPPRPPHNHHHETGEITRRDGETARVSPSSGVKFFL